MEATLEVEHVIGVKLCGGALHYHPDAHTYIYAIGALVVIADLNDAHSQQILRGHTSSITALALSKTGSLIASAQDGDDPDVLVWDYRTQQTIFRLEEHDSVVAAVGFSHDDCLLVTLGSLDDNKVVIWDMSNGYIVATLPRLPYPTACISFAGFVRDIKRRDTSNYQLVSAGNSNIVFWDVDPYAGTLQHERVNCQSRGMVVRDTVAVNISDDKETVYCAAKSGDFLIVNVKQRQVIGAVTASRLGVQQVLSWPDGLITGGGDGCLNMYDRSYRRIKEATLDSAVHHMSLSPDKLEMIAVTHSGTVYRINLETMAFMILSENPSAAVRKIGISREVDDKFVTVSGDCRVRLWDAMEYMVLTNVTATGAGQPLCCVYGAELILSGWEDGCVRTFDEAGRPLWLIQPCHQGPVTAMALPANYRFILTAGEDGAVRLWEIRTRELISHLKEHGQIVNDLQLFGNDTHALSCSRDRSLLCWDLRKEKRLTSHTQRMGGINSVALTKDETQVITVGQEKKITFWDLRASEPVHQTWAAPDAAVSEHPGNEAKCIATSPDGVYFATGSRDGRIRLWEMRSCRMLFSTEAHSDTCNDLYFTPNNRQLISAGEDGSIFVWNLYTNT